MTQVTPYSVNTYRDILQTLHDIEVEDDKFRERRFWVCVASIICTVIFLIVYIIFFKKNDWSILLSGDTVKVFLLPIFSYLFMSLQEDSISERKSALYASFRDLYYNDNDEIQILKATSMTDEELRQIVKELIKNKLQ